MKTLFCFLLTFLALQFANAQKIKPLTMTRGIYDTTWFAPTPPVDTTGAHIATGIVMRRIGDTLYVAVPGPHQKFSVDDTTTLDDGTFVNIQSYSNIQYYWTVDTLNTLLKWRAKTGTCSLIWQQLNQ